ncbi:phage tail protein [Streptomyces millisiae]|uniref:Uncharacterized protein n=1 Tax=Streptomyces millisiae TaxID=3075542 RepID=A0ABU2LP39_9ACTN|nr:hypothetical protein [Streptomyces sp. DSM 44918]MDT0319361.1 hypothetical protein [Streptomyces sp. DSM 44918]
MKAPKAASQQPTTPKDRPQPPARTPATTTAAPVSAPAPAPVGGLSPGGVRALQRAAGNAAVSRLVAQRYVEPVKPPPAQAPGFRKVQQDVTAKKTRLAAHQPAATESRSAQDAAVAPPNDVEAQGKAANAEKMNQAKPGEFDKAAFIAAVNEAIDKQAPKNLEEADEFGDSGKADQIKESVDGKVSDGKESSAEDIATTTAAPPDTSQAKEKQVTPMTADQAPANPGAPSAADATPEKQPPEVTDFSAGPAETNQKMADAEVTEEQLAKGNEPQFNEALSSKKSAEQHSATAPAQGRAAENAQLDQTKAAAAQEGAKAMNQLTQTRQQAGRQVDSGKGETKSRDERRREEVTAKLQSVFDATKRDVEGTLKGLDRLVDDQFTSGEKQARDAFTADHERRMKAYKDKRYGGFLGPAKWAKDKLLGMPEEANQIYQHSRRLYVEKMRGVISGIADTIGRELGRAKDRIARGRAELKAAVDKLPADLRQFGQEAAADFASQFDDLESQVNDKSQELVQTLAQKYTEALNAVDEEIKKLQEANKGLVQKAIDAVVGVIQTILELKNMLLGILAKAASAVMKIIKDPIGFLGTLVRGMSQGLQNFVSNIATHLQTGLVSWLLGTAVKGGIEIPAKFDLKGIIQLIASLLGLTWDTIRAKIVRRGVPEQAMTTVESSVPVAGALAKEGPAGAVDEIKQDTGDLKSQILDDLKSYLIPTVIIAGITWIMSLLTPASAFIRAVKGIIDIVTFIVTQGAQILEFVNSVLDAVIAIANGDTAGAPKLIETALANSIPLLIGFLAALVGIGGLANKVRSVFQKVSRPVNRAIDKIITRIANAGKKLWRKIKKKNPGKDDSPEGKKDRLDKGLRDAVNAVNEHNGQVVDDSDLRPLLAPIKRKYKLTELRPKKRAEKWEIYGRVNPDGVESTYAENVKKYVEAIPGELSGYGKDLSVKIRDRWWIDQLEEAKAWNDIGVLDGFEGEAVDYLSTDMVKGDLEGFFDKGKNGGIKRRKGPDSDEFKGYALHELNPNPIHSVRSGFYERLSDSARAKLKGSATEEVKASASLSAKLEKLDFSEDRNFGRFSSLPVPKREVDPQLKEAAGAGKIGKFLTEMVTPGESGGVSWGRLQQLWNEKGAGENPHRKFLKGEFRRLQPGHHEWVPTDMMIRMVETAIDQGATPQSMRWLELQDKLRSFTTDVIWEIRPSVAAGEIESHGMDAHVGAFETHAGDFIYNGRDKKWHDSLRNYFEDFIAGNRDGAPAEFLDKLIRLLRDGKLMWNGSTADFSEEQKNLPIKAVYKSILIDADRVGEGAQLERPFTVAELGEAQERAYARVLNKFESLYEYFSS